MNPQPDRAPTPTERALRRVGSVLAEKWTIERLIGVGGMAAVYVGVHRNTKRAALKILHRELATDVDIRARFLREGYVANSVGHPGAVRVDDDDSSDDGSIFLVMELLEGETVHARFNRKARRLETPEALWIADQTLDVLEAAHAKGILHRDIKPENLFLTRDGRLKVLDFGIARLRETSCAITSTQSGMSMGTPAYMAPEQARGRWDEVDSRTDLWAVGAVLYTLLTGELVHQAETPNEALGKAMSTEAMPIRDMRPDIPEAIAKVVDRALTYHKGRRYASAGAMRAALREGSRGVLFRSPALTLPEVTSSGQSPHEITVPALPLTRRRPRSPIRAGRRWVAVGSAGLLAAFAGAQYALPSRPPATPTASGERPGGRAPAPEAEHPVVAPVGAPLEATAKLQSMPSSDRSPQAGSSAERSAKSVRRAPSIAPSGARGEPDAGSTSTAGSRASECDPPFYHDARGIKRFRPECL